MIFQKLKKKPYPKQNKTGKIWVIYFIRARDFYLHLLAPPAPPLIETSGVKMDIGTKSLYSFEPSLSTIEFLLLILNKLSP